MNTETQKLLEQLASKLGTTTEYLWGVLLRQAMWSSIIYLIQCVVLLFTSWLVYKVHIHLSNDDNAISYYENEVLGGIMITTSVFVGIMWIICFFSLSDCINGFVNPEFWALDYVINKLK